MKRSDFQSKTNEELVSIYEQAANVHRRATDLGQPKVGNKAHDELAAAYRELRRRGLEAQALLLPFLTSAELGVRGWAAAHALEFAPDQAEPVLEELSRMPKLIGFSAQMTLKVWREGKLRFP